ncbi:MAG: RsiV family protein [Pseudomonadota bacterium]
MKRRPRKTPGAMASLLAIAALACSAAAQTVIDETSAAFRARVTLAPEVAAEPGLAGFLREEAEETVALYRDIAREEARRVSVEITDRLTILTPDYASVLRAMSIREGAAQTELLETLTTDRRTGQFLRLDAFLGGPDGRRVLNDLAETLAQEIARQGHGGSPSERWASVIRAATRPDLTVLQNFTLRPDGTGSTRIGAIVFHFAPGAVAPPQVGPIAVAIPAAQLRPGLKPGIASRFAR